MAIQILGLRPSPTGGPDSKIEKFFEKHWRAQNLEDLFTNLDRILQEIPPEDRFNLFYTVADCHEIRGRKLKEQWAIPFDVDGVDVERLDQTVAAVLGVLNLDKSQALSIFTGNGIHVLVGLKDPITEEEYFERMRPHYRALCDRVDLALAQRSLPGHCDPSVFSKARILRLPKTMNVKPGKEPREARFIGGALVPLDFSLEAAAGLPKLGTTDHITKAAFSKYPPPDTEAVLSECQFLKRCKEDPDTLPENEWYGMLSITARLSNGVEVSHDLSRGHHGYTREETDQKIKQALEASGPRTCSNINSMWGKCSTCKHFNTELKSPILIRGPNYIKTQTTGFHDMREDNQGRPRAGKPNYEDLRRFFEQQHRYVSTKDSEMIYRWSDTHWVIMSDTDIRAFAQKHFNPKADTRMRNEFLNLLRCTNLKDADWFNESTYKKMNFKNGVLDLDTMELMPHTPEVGFRHVLPYDFNPEAEAPRFEQFLKEVTLGRQELIDVLMEFAGYAFSNDSCWAQKALILTGEGANGKSTFMDILKVLAGEENYSSLTLSDIRNDANRYELEGKLFNLAEETATSALLDSSLFKNLVTGGETMVKVLYKQPFRITNRTKLLMACNELPKSKDTTAALFRRLLVVPFQATFDGSSADVGLKQKLFEELPGIFNYVIAGYKRLLESRRFTDSPIIRGEVEAYQADLDPVVVFTREYLEILDITPETFEKNFVACRMIYSSYTDFVRERNEEAVTYSTFFKRLRKLIPEYDRRYTRPLEGSDRARGLRSVHLYEFNEF